MQDGTRLCFTTSKRAVAETRRYAQDRARHWNASYADRDETSPSALAARFEAVLVFEQARVRLVTDGGDVAFHPGMAFRRIERLHDGRGDALADIGCIRPGQRVLDGTLGLGQDALVAAAAVGPSGRVVGVEGSRVLAAFATEGLPTCLLPPGVSADVPRRIEVHHGETGAWLRAGSEPFDLVLLDPMFDRPKRTHHSFDVLRRHALAGPIGDDMIDAALERAPSVLVRLGSAESLASLRHRPSRTRGTQASTWAVFERS